MINRYGTLQRGWKPRVDTDRHTFPLSSMIQIMLQSLLLIHNLHALFPLQLPSSPSSSRQHLPKSLEYDFALSKPQNLRLPVAVAVDVRLGSRFNSHDRMQHSLGRKLLISSANTLVHLSLAARDLLISDDDDNAFRMPWANGIMCIDHLLLELTFPSLRQLDLEGWPLGFDYHLKNFWAGYTDSLRVLKMQDCGVYSCRCFLARWAGKICV